MTRYTAKYPCPFCKEGSECRISEPSDSADTRPDKCKEKACQILVGMQSLGNGKFRQVGVIQW